MSAVWFTSDLHLLLEDEPVAAYWNGFLMADGTFTGVGGNRMKVALARKDHDHIERQTPTWSVTPRDEETDRE